MLRNNEEISQLKNDEKKNKKDAFCF